MQFVTGPGNKPIFVLTGEGHREELELYVGALLKFHMNRVNTGSLPIAVSKIIEGKKETILKFPSKVCKHLFKYL